ncbi:Gfo/Idh/MocA family oxidoreductase [Ruminococcaceae bacterium OttesenSCG-928-L11]|nr:Gfo/Idh/MocA family oxidoreductase [Ruminococcaceae bacterium OttesenSCG-928-L11]
MSEKQLRAAIVGCGGIAQVHCAALTGLEGVSIVAVCDIVEERAAKLGEKAGAAVFTDFAAMLAETDIDVLHICTPHALHESMARAAAEKGIAVFTEKPPVVTHSQWADFQASAEKVPVGICFQNRYNPETRRMEELIRSPEAGKILGGRAFVTWHRTEPYYTESGWRGTWKTEGGGALMNQAIHTLDLLIRMIGKPAAVSANAANHHLKGVIEVEDTMSAYLTFDNAASATFYATTAYVTDAPVMVEILCENRTVRLEGGVVTCRCADGTVETEDFNRTATAWKDYWGNGHKACIADYYDSIRGGKPYQNDVASVGNTMSAVLGIYDSIRTGATINL